MSQTNGTARTRKKLVERDFDRRSLAAVRGEIHAYGAAYGLTDVALAHFVLAVNEITTNAVRHAGGCGRLRMWIDDGELCCEVVDHGPGIPAHRLERSRSRATDRIGGHGMWLARHICHEFEIETDRTGTRVALRFTAPQAQWPGTDGEG
jgi:serine/threonine-protein kinase RsbW